MPPSREIDTAVVRSYRVLLGLLPPTYLLLWATFARTDLHDPLWMRVVLVVWAVLALGVSFTRWGRPHIVDLTGLLLFAITGHLLVLEALNGLVYDYYVGVLFMVFVTTAALMRRAWLVAYGLGTLVAVIAVAWGTPYPEMPPLRFATALTAFTVACTWMALQRIAGLDALRDRERRLREMSAEQARLAEVIDHSSDFVGVGDVTGRILFINRTGLAWLGVPLASLAGRSVLDLADDDARPVIRDQVLPALLAGERWRGTLPHTRADGTRAVFEASAFPVVDPATGEATHVAAIARDVTRRHEVERMKDEFVSMVSHEIRTPLASISGSLGLLDAGVGGELSDKSGRLVAIARSNAERLVRLVNDVLDIEKIEAGRLELHLADIDPAALVQATVASLEPLAAKHDIRLDDRVRPLQGAVLRADADRFVQVVTNLLSNAIRHSPDGGRITLTSDVAGDRLRIAVRDEGPGVPADQVGRLFRRFEQLGAGDRPKGGTGLGLAISKAIVAQHGGRIGVDVDVPGGGARFWFELPLTAPASPATRATAEEPA